jgi:hypothetical protein
MNFEEAKILMFSGERIRRRAWRHGNSISCKDGDRFITLTIHFEDQSKEDIHKKWMPYVDDFIEVDWVVAPDFVLKTSPIVKRVSRYRRDPVI